MRALSRLLRAVALLSVLAPRAAFAGTLSDPAGSRTVQLVHGFWSLVADVATRPGDGDDPPDAPSRAAGDSSRREGRAPGRPRRPEPADGHRVAARAKRSAGTTTASASPLPAAPPGMGDFSIGSNESVPGHLLVVQGTADIYGKLLGNLVTVDGDVVIHPGGVVSGDILTLGGEVRDEGGEIGGEVRTFRTSSVLDSPLPVQVAAAPTALETVFRRMAGVVGVFLTLGALGFGLVMFGRPNLEVVSDTVSHSFGRAFTTGLLGQLLLLPTFGMLVVGLILSVVGHRAAAVRGRGLRAAGDRRRGRRIPRRRARDGRDVHPAPAGARAP